jgi:predicted dehydrogenase
MANLEQPPFQQHWPLPSQPRPIVVIGAGSVVNDAHLPAYAQANFSVAGIYDIQHERAQTTAAKFGIPKTYESLAEAASNSDAVFDVAVPPDQLDAVLERLPQRAAVLMQKPMGRNLAEARQIVALCREKQLAAAVNFQLRFSPMMLAFADILRRGLIGPIVDVDVHLNYREPWELFPFLKSQPRVELLIASIHYFDWIRSILGEPAGVYARSIPHPRYPELEATRSSAILDYGNQVRCSLSLNNTWQHGFQHATCAIRVEGLNGAAVVKLGCLVNYPHGEPDGLEYVTEGRDWSTVPLEGNWFPDAFRGPMSNLQRFTSGEDATLLTSVDNALKTMALIEALYASSRQGATAIPLG